MGTRSACAGGSHQPTLRVPHVSAGTCADSTVKAPRVHRLATILNLRQALFVIRAGHSLGGFAAATCLILCDRILTCTAFESPGLTTFYHRLAAQQGDEAYWRERITNYLAIPNPINMCQKHLGRIIRYYWKCIVCRNAGNIPVCPTQVC